MLSINFRNISAIPLIALLLSSLSANAQVFDEPHVLTTVGHTNSADWDNGLAKYVATCDYKSIHGAAPRKGEACDGSPRLFITMEDLNSLEYVTRAQDHLDFVRRVYERFPRVLFVSSPEASFHYGSSQEGKTSQQIDFRHVLPEGVSVNDYDFFSGRAASFLAGGNSGVYQNDHIIAGVLGPFANNVFLGGTLDDVQRLLPEYTIAFFYNNPDRATLTHELIHILISRAKERSIVNRERLIELGQNEGKRSYLKYLFFDDTDFSESSLDPMVLAYWDLMYLQYTLENRATSTPEELEVAYFLSKYGNQLNLPTHSVMAHQNDFWQYVEEYRRVIDEIYSNPIQGRVPESIIEPVNTNASFSLNGRLIPGFFKDYFRQILAIAKAYPKDLLGDENNVNRTNPRTIIDHFVVDVGPRESTTAQR